VPYSAENRSLGIWVMWDIVGMTSVKKTITF